jgi:hypothetical protein
VDIEGRLLRFIESVERYEPAFQPDGALADLFNVLREEAQRQLPEDPIVVAVPQAEKGHMSGRSVLEAGALAAVAQQLLTAVAESSDRPLVG